MRKLGYLRVSTHEQRPDRQIDGLVEICDELFIEYASAIRKSRPVYDELISKLESEDCLVIWDLDRAFRSTVDAILEVEKLKARQINLEIVNMNVDTTTPSGMLIYTVISAFAEFEHRMLSQRTREGLAAARKRGQRLGRPHKLTEAQIDEALARIRERGDTIKDIADSYNVAAWTLSRAIKRMYPDRD
ncbi:MAG: recombinase family protein [Pseudomonadota bacterium]